MGVKMNRQYKDRVLRKLLSESKENALSLYNALNNSNYTNAEDLEFNTIEDVIYMGMKNDFSVLFQMEINLYEHQSTLSPNYPLRGFLYLPRLYESYIQKRRLNVYGSKLVKIPTPHYVVLYNGKEDTEEQYELKLSDAFEHAGGCVELTCTVYNINAGHNPELMERCPLLREYAELVARIRSGQDGGLSIDDAVNEAVDSCIREGILKDFLLKHKAEVVGMLLTEYNEAETMELLREEAREEGWAEGREEGRAEGREEGREAGREEALLYSLRTLMEANGWTPLQSMDCLKIPAEKRQRFSKLLV